MLIFGLNATEILILQRWQSICGLPVEPISPKTPFADIYEARRQWLAAGGSLPVTEEQALFLQPKREAA